MVPSEDELTQLTLEHWRKFLPRLTTSLAKSGTLEVWARNAARQTLEAVQRKVDDGTMHPLEAYHMLQNDWCFLRPADWDEPQPE